MLRIRKEDLPFKGSSHHFVGEHNGEVNVSVFLFNGQPGSGPGRIGIPTTKSSSSSPGGGGTR